VEDAWRSQGFVKVNRALMPLVDVLFGHEGDVAEVLTEAAHGPVWHTLESFAPMAERVVSGVPKSEGDREHGAQADYGEPQRLERVWIYADGKSYEALKFDDLEILDRVGGGDSFASGLIYGLLDGKGMKWALDCGVAHGALAMTTAGDSSMATPG
jgi:2-dehydro-3-deoxygluconokinase